MNKFEFWILKFSFSFSFAQARPYVLDFLNSKLCGAMFSPQGCFEFRLPQFFMCL